MRSMRSLFVGALLLALTTLAACGGGTGASTGATPTQAAASSAGEPTDQPVTTPTENPGGGGGAGGDLNSLVEALTPPNSTQVSRTEAQGGVFISWTSTDSVDSLKSFYQGAIPATGMKIFSTTDASGATAWIFAETEGSSHGGSVTVAPSTDGTNTSAVILTVTSE
jgi:hypothetical protein